MRSAPLLTSPACLHARPWPCRARRGLTRAPGHAPTAGARRRGPRARKQERSRASRPLHKETLPRQPKGGCSCRRPPARSETPARMRSRLRAPFGIAEGAAASWGRGKAAAPRNTRAAAPHPRAHRAAGASAEACACLQCGRAPPAREPPSTWRGWCGLPGDAPRTAREPRALAPPLDGAGCPGRLPWQAASPLFPRRPCCCASARPLPRMLR